ncbi:MAG: c-type cytochrome [Planctomycetota bacterium]
MVMPSDVTQGPEGAVYVADWHDQRTAHPDPDADWDRSNGRIVRIQANEAPPAPRIDFATQSTGELLALLDHPNGWIARQVLRQIADRRDPEISTPCRQLLQHQQGKPNGVRALWALYVSGGFQAENSLDLLRHPQEDVRWWTIRFLGDEGNVPPRVLEELVVMARKDPSLRVRSQLASSAKRFHSSQGLPIVHELVRHDEDVMDDHLPLLNWWAIEGKSVKDRTRVLDGFAGPNDWRIPMVRQWILPRLMQRYAAEGTDEGYSACLRMLSSCPNEDSRRQMLASFEAGIAGRKFSQTPNPLKPLVSQLLADASNSPSSLVLAAKLGDEGARKRGIALIRDAAATTSSRKALIAVLGETQDPDVQPALLALIARGNPAEIQSEAIAALRPFSNPSLFEELLRHYATSSKELRMQMRSLFFNRLEWAREFLTRMDGGRIAKEDIAVDELSPLALHEDGVINELVRKHWGSIGAGTPEEILAEVRRLNNDLRAAAGDDNAGREQFRKHCAACHQLFGEGNKIGPDLTTANRKDRDYLLVSLVNPSVVIRKEYLAYIVETADGRVLTGLISDQTPATVTLLDAKNQKTTIPMSQIVNMKESTVSLMPERLYRELSPSALRNLFAYLQKEATP